MLCTTLNPFIATGALIIPSSIYAVLKVRSVVGSSGQVDGISGVVLVFQEGVGTALGRGRAVGRGCRYGRCCEFVGTDGCGSGVCDVATQTFVLKPYNVRRNRRKSLDLRRATYAQVEWVFDPGMCVRSVVGGAGCCRCECDACCARGFWC